MTIYLTTSYKLINEAAKQYNDGKPITEQLRAAHLNLMRMLISLFAKQLQKESRVKIRAGKIPPLFTNNIQLAEMLQCSPRTIQRHILRLSGPANFIQNKVFRGSNASFTLQLNPTLYTLHETLQPEKKQAPAVIFTLTQNSFCRDTDTGTSTNKLNSVEGRPIPRPNSLNIDRLHGKQGTMPRNGRQGGEISRPGHLDPAPELSPAQLLTIREYITNLWNFIFIKWYADKLKFITESQVKYAWDYFFNDFSRLPETQWRQLWKEHVIRIIQVRSYTQRDPGRYVPLPSVMFANQTLYNRTRQWYLNQRQTSENFAAWKQDYEVAIHESKIFQTTLKKYLKQPDYYTFRECEQRLSKNGNPAALNEFYKMAIVN